MSPDTILSFTLAADPDLSAVRGSLLLLLQTGEASAVEPAAEALERMRRSAEDAGILTVRDQVHHCLQLLPDASASREEVTAASLQALDKLAEVEATIFQISLESGSFLDEACDLIDSVFDDEVIHLEEHLASPQFEVDEETLDVFRDEAANLMSRLDAALQILEHDPQNRDALWEIRRSAHTFKGSAGILGIHDLAEIAHQLENVLDLVVDDPAKVDGSTVSYMRLASEAMSRKVLCGIVPDKDLLDTQYRSAMSQVATVEQTTVVSSALTSSPGPTPGSEAPPRPVVRVSVDRLDEIIDLSRDLLLNRSGLVDCCSPGYKGGRQAEQLHALLETSRQLTELIHQKLQNIRMIRFGTLQTRLLRAVNATCSDIGKKADLVIQNGDIEIDTELVDRLVEPLLHVLKNAVVHGIESPEQRRLMGKCDKGVVTVSVRLEQNSLVVDVGDDGAGISTHDLMRRAEALGISTDGERTLDLIFERGLTTAQTVDLNAGRGVGMSIVRDCVEAAGGSVSVRSMPQRGTNVTLRLPLLRSVIDPGVVITPRVVPNHKVLVVDDSPTVRAQMAGMLKGLGLTVWTADDGFDALQKLSVAEEKPDLILSDIEMPHLDGWSLLDSIKTDIDLMHIPIVMVTSLNGEDHRQMAHNLGAAGFLQKPFSTSDVETALSQAGLLASV